MKYNNMRELSVNEVQEVNGGLFVSGAWVIYGAYRAYKAYRAVRRVTQFVASAEAGYHYGKQRD